MVDGNCLSRCFADGQEAERGSRVISCARQSRLAVIGDAQASWARSGQSDLRGLASVVVLRSLRDANRSG